MSDLSWPAVDVRSATLMRDARTVLRVAKAFAPWYHNLQTRGEEEEKKDMGCIAS